MSPITWIRIWLRNICFILAGIELASREPNSFHSTPIHLVFLCIRHNAGHKHDPDTFPECKNLGHWEFSEAWVCGNLTLPGKAWNQNCNKEPILDIPLTHFLVLCSCLFKIMTISYIDMVIPITESMLACFTPIYLCFFPVGWNKYYILTAEETKAQKGFIPLNESNRCLLVWLGAIFKVFWLLHLSSFPRNAIIRNCFKPWIIYKRQGRVQKLISTTCTWVFITALFMTAKTLKQPRCSSGGEWIK